MHRVPFKKPDKNEILQKCQKNIFLVILAVLPKLLEFLIALLETEKKI